MEGQGADAAVARLCNDTLADLPDAVLRPQYDRAGLTPGIVHIGLGNFHRAHQAWYLHRLMQAGAAHDWAIIGAGVRASDEIQRKKLAEQDYLTTLIQLDPSGQSAEVTGAMIDYVAVMPDNAALIAQMAAPEIRIVALTVTEGGYYIDPATKGFDATHPDIVHDAAHPDRPVTAFGAMVAALKQRRDLGFGPFTGLCCDNLQGNGAVLRRCVVSLARLSDPDLASWIDTHCSFPGSMVDCIVPATGPKELELVHAMGIGDAAPVTHENFRQWVIEDDFCAGRPDWDQAGATFTANVHDYEAMKLRILNGGHQVLATPGEVMSVDTIAGCITHPKLGALFSRLARAEIVPHVKAVPGMHPEAYVDLIVQRFANPHIIDTTRRVAFDGSARHPGFILPSVRDGLAAGTPVDGLALVEAIWARMCEGTRSDGSTIAPNDPLWDDLQGVAKVARTDPAAWLRQTQYYGDLADQPRFADAFTHWLQMIWRDGTEVAIDAWLAGDTEH